MHRKKQAKQENLEREATKSNTYAPAINKYSRKIAEAGSIANVQKAKLAKQEYVPDEQMRDGPPESKGRESDQ
jgi:hypothetical protein